MIRNNTNLLKVKIRKKGREYDEGKAEGVNGGKYVLAEMPQRTRGAFLNNVPLKLF